LYVLSIIIELDWLSLSIDDYQSGGKMSREFGGKRRIERCGIGIGDVIDQKDREKQKGCSFLFVFISSLFARLPSYNLNLN
jgi:hypothetical protein